MYCAMIGDLIGSKKLKPAAREKIQARLRQLLDEMNYEFSDYLASPFLLTLGDEFQGLLTAAEAAMEIVEYMDRGLAEYQVRVRYGLGLGEINTGTVNRDQALGDDGPAYHRAREGVELLKKERWSGFPVAVRTGEADAGLLWSACQLLNDLVEDWSDTQRQCVLDMEVLGEQLLVAEKNHMQQSGVSRALKRGHFKTYQQAKAALKEYFLSTYDCPPSAGRLGRYNRAVAMERNEKYAEGLTLLEELLEEVPGCGGGEPPLRTDILALQSKCYLGLGQYEPAIERMEAAIGEEEQCRQGQSEYRLVEKYAWLGRYYISLAVEARGPADGERRVAAARKVVEVLSRALALSQGRPTLEMKIRGNLALAYGIIEGPQREIDFRIEYQRWLESQEVQNVGTTCVSLHNLSCAYVRAGQMDKAMEFSRRAIQLAEQMVVQPSDMYQLYRTYGYLLGQTAPDCREAIPYLEKALALAKRGNYLRGIVAVCKMLEPLYAEAENQEALDWTMEQRFRAERSLQRKRGEGKAGQEEPLIEV